jgi:CubicO group peptidase (beta-lactamase class C family)
MLALALCVWAVVQPSPCFSLDTAKLDAFIQGAMATYGVPGASVAVVENDSVIFMKGYGVRELHASAAVDEHTIFPIASTTKWFTAAGLGVLVDQERVSLDEPIVNRIPWFAMKDVYAGAHASLRDFLAHRSGLKAYDGDVLGMLGYDNREILWRVRFMIPGTGFRERDRYSNMGFFIAGEVAAAVDPDYDTWEEHMLRRIIEPLGMTRTSSYFSGLAIDDNHISGHMGHPDNVRPMTVEPDPMPAAGQMVSTASDLARWMRMLLNSGEIDGDRILTPGTVREICKPSMVHTGSSPVLPYPESAPAEGLGCTNFHYLQYEVVEKNGANIGDRSIVTLIPSMGTGIAVLANLNVTQFTEAVRAYFLELYLGILPGHDVQGDILALQPKVDATEAIPEPPPDAEPATLPLGAYAGRYKSDLYGFMDVRESAGGLVNAFGPIRLRAAIGHFDGDAFLATYPKVDMPFDILEFTISPSSAVTSVSSRILGVDFAKEIAHNDFDGDGKTDPAVCSSGRWRVLLSGSGWGETLFRFGDGTGIALSGDADGDGKTDPVVCRPDRGEWSALLSGSGYRAVSASWGGRGFLPVVGDYDGDGKADPAEFYQSTGTLRMFLSGSGYAGLSMSFNAPGCMPVAGDYDTDGITDPAAYQSSSGILGFMRSSHGYDLALYRTGVTRWVPSPGDYDRDGKSDPALYDAGSGVTGILLSGSGYAPATHAFVAGGGMPACGDFDGDGIADPATYDPATGRWRILRSGSSWAETSFVFGKGAFVPGG